MRRLGGAGGGRGGRAAMGLAFVVVVVVFSGGEGGAGGGSLSFPVFPSLSAMPALGAMPPLPHPAPRHLAAVTVGGAAGDAGMLRSARLRPAGGGPRPARCPPGKVWGRRAGSAPLRSSPLRSAPLLSSPCDLCWPRRRRARPSAAGPGNLLPTCGPPGCGQPPLRSESAVPGRGREGCAAGGARLGASSLLYKHLVVSGGAVRARC